MGISNVRKPARSAALGLTLTPLFLALTGCLAGGGGGSDANPARTGVFIDSPVTFEPLGDARINLKPCGCRKHDIDVTKICTETSMLAAHQ